MISHHPDNMKTPSVSLLLGVSVLLLLSGLTVSADHRLVLKFSDYPVMKGSDVTLYCENRNGDFVEAYFFFNETLLGSNLQTFFIIHKTSQSNEGLYSCGTDDDGKSPESRLRVTDPPTTSDPHTTTSSTTSDPHTTILYNATAFNNTDPSAFASVTRLFLHVVVFSPYCICTILMVSTCCSRKTENRSGVSMEMTENHEIYDDIAADVTTEHDLHSNYSVTPMNPSVTS